MAPKKKLRKNKVELNESERRKSAISSLISISSLESSRRLIVRIIDANVSQKVNSLNTNKEPTKLFVNSCMDKDSPRVQLVRIDLPETLLKIPLEPSVGSEKIEDDLKGLGEQDIYESSGNRHSPGSTQLSDSSNMSLSLQLSDESVNDHLPEQSEVKGVRLVAQFPKVSSRMSTDSNLTEILHQSTEAGSSEPVIDKSYSRENKSLASSSDADRTPLLDKDLDEIEDSDEELLTLRIFEEDNDEEKSSTRGVSKKRKRRKY